MRWSLAILVLVLAASGCASPQPPSPGADPPSPIALERTQQADLRLGWGYECKPVCSYDTTDDDMPRFGLARNETAVSAHVEIRANGTLPPQSTVVVKFDCDGAAGPECPTLATAEGELPFVLDLPHLSAGAGATLRVSAYLRNGTLHDAGGGLNDFPRRAVDGNPMAIVVLRLGILVDPRAPPALVPVEHDLEIDGDVSCAVLLHQPPTYPGWGCSFFLGPVYYVLDYDGEIVRSQATLTWTPASPATERLILTGSCNMPARSGSPCPDLRDATVAGPSPLTVTVEGQAARFAGLEWAVGTEGTGAQTPQAYHLHIATNVLEEPFAPEDQ